MNDRVLIRTGTTGAVLAAICCATPVLAVLLPLVGLGAWRHAQIWCRFHCWQRASGSSRGAFIGAAPKPPGARRRFTKKA